MVSMYTFKPQVENYRDKWASNICIQYVPIITNLDYKLQGNNM